MKKYAIVAESGADLSQTIIGRHPIYISPMHVALGNEDHLDGFISIDDLCGYYEKTGKVPMTAAASPYDYQQVYEKIRKDDPDSIIIHICYSEKLSATYQNSLIAAEGLDQIYHVDSMNVSVGQGFIVMKAVDLIKENPDITPDELISQIEKFSSKTRFSFVPGNLDYLRAGGRVSNAQYLGAAILKIKPLIELIDGKLITTKKYKGARKKIIYQLINGFFTDHNIDKDRIFIVYVHSIDAELKTAIEKQIEEFGVKETVWLKAGAVITSHSGPGGIGIAGCV